MFGQGKEDGQQGPEDEGRQEGCLEEGPPQEGCEEGHEEGGQGGHQEVAEARRRGPGGRFMTGSAPPKPIYSWTDSEEK